MMNKPTETEAKHELAGSNRRAVRTIAGPENFLSAFSQALEAAMEAGITPTEVWFGPDATIAFSALIRDRLGPVRRVERSGAFTFHGLVVRLMKPDGIRVGVSAAAYEKPENRRPEPAE